MTYATLKSDIADWLARDDLTAVIPSLIRLAEASIRRDIRVRAMETATTLTITDGSASVPSDFLEARRLILNNTTAWGLDYVTPEVMYSTEVYNETGTAVCYTIEGDSFIFRPKSSETALLSYFAAFDALSDEADTNWLLTNAYDVYLYGALMHSAPYLKEDERAGVWADGYRTAVSAVNKKDGISRFSGSPLKIMGGSVP